MPISPKPNPRNLPSGEAHWAWKGDKASAIAKRVRARRRFALGPCQECEAPGVERHHRDGDPGNNVPENIAILCRRCHMVADGRLEAFGVARESFQAGRRIKDSRPCVNCGLLPEQSTRRFFSGRCWNCGCYWLRVGSDRPKRLGIGGPVRAQHMSELIQGRAKKLAEAQAASATE